MSKTIVGVLCVAVSLVVLPGSRSLAEAQPSAKANDNVHTRDVDKLPAKFDATLGMNVAPVEGIVQLEVFVGRIAPGQKSLEQRFLYEQMIYVVDGTGYTEIWKDAKSQPLRVEWAKGDLISPPFNFKHRHVNTSPQAEAVLFFVTTKPLAANMLGTDVLSMVDYSDPTLWEEYSGIKEPTNTSVLTDAYQEVKAGFLIKDIKNRPLPFTREGHYGIALLPKIVGASMAGNRMFEAQIFDLLPPSEATVNRHPWEVVYFVLKGKGAGVFFYDGGPESLIHFDEADVFVEPSLKWHNHGPVDGSGYRIIQMKASGYFRGAMKGVDVEHPPNAEKLVDAVKRLESKK